MVVLRRGSTTDVEPNAEHVVVSNADIIARVMLVIVGNGLKPLEIVSGFTERKGSRTG
jgi:hypothetical protein